MTEEHSETPADLFEELKNIRIKKKLELEKIAEKTKINIKYLIAIESGNFKDIPEIYDKLFFQTYLSALKIRNPEKYLDQYRELRKEKKPDYTTTVQKIRSMPSDPEKFIKTKQLYLIIPVLIVVLVIIFLAINSKILSTDTNVPVKELSVQEVANEIEYKINPPIEKKAEIPAVAGDSSKVKVQLSTNSLTWLRLVKDMSDTSEYLLKSGEKLDLESDSVMTFLVGNAAGVNFTVNGKNEGVLGNTDQVISYLKITSKGIISKRLKEIQKESTPDDTTTIN